MKRKRELLTFGTVLSALAVCTAVLLLAMRQNGAVWFLELLQASDMVLPEKIKAFSAFHLIWLAVCVLLAIGAGFLGYKCQKKHLDRLFFGFGCGFYLMELYKQFYSFYVLQDRVYDFGFFPFQFCSLPIYLCLIIPFLPSGRCKDTLYGFFALFETMGGCLVMGYPAFYDRMSLCIHTMLWHTAMIWLGVYILFARGFGKSWRREVLPATAVFLPALALATLLNILLTPYAAASPNPLNLFYISPFQNTRFLIIQDVQKTFGWLPSLVTYAALFIFVGATLVFGVVFVIRRLALRAKMCKKE